MFRCQSCHVMESVFLHFSSINLPFKEVYLDRWEILIIIFYVVNYLSVLSPYALSIFVGSRACLCLFDSNS